MDVGSNSVRLVVYRGGARVPVPLFNEKALCALGQGLANSGRLNPEGRALARAAVGRFVALARAMGVERLEVLATAAVRDAEDGPDLVADLERDNTIRVQVLSGRDEARRAAEGVLCAVPEAEGVVADLGGGSLDLVWVQGGRFKDTASFPLGLLRLTEASGGDRAMAESLLDEALAREPWLSRAGGEAVYAVGGAWRALARVCMDRLTYPLHVLDNFTVSATDARPLLAWVAEAAPKDLMQVQRLSKKRVPMLPLAAMALGRLVDAVRPRRVVFSVYGVREGQFMHTLPEALRRQDPLLASMKMMARDAGRFPVQGDEVATWMEPLFPAEPPDLARMRHAASLIGDIFWNEHPDYRADQAFHRMLRLPFMGLNHRDRAALALVVYHRYGGDGDASVVVQAEALLDDPARARRTRVIGAALRLAHTLSGGAPGVLSRTTLARDLSGRLTLTVPDGDPLFEPEFLERRLEKLARVLDADPVVVTAP
nr:Ppx/GppA family phosphatase [Roseospira visakhapatnamensis]